ncbi:MAG TPA: hypothetical protein VLG49_00630 [Rhabdochlamydiaceae bacterium]|nr:hypothetical protein [Rhabdochlamydiaceae bacterium]
MHVSLNDFAYSAQRIENRLGFDDIEMFDLANKLSVMKITMDRLAKQGFHYVGDTKSDSKAYTDVSKKRIFIGKDKTTSEACLSLMYEMTNATNAYRIKEIQSSYLSDKSPNRERAIEYAQAILGIEAEAVFNRSIAAIDLGLEHLIKNKKYLEIVKLNQDNPDAAIKDIHLEMLENGTVHNGKKKALDYYISQYFECNYNSHTL